MQEVKYYLYYIYKEDAKEDKRKIYSQCDESAISFGKSTAEIMNAFSWKVVSVKDGKIAGNY